MKKILCALLVLVMVLSMAACGGSSNSPAVNDTPNVNSPTEATEDTRVFNLGIGSEISNIVPMSNNVALSNRDGLFVFAIYDPLLWYDTTTDTLNPWLATEWSHSEDGTEWNFTLRDDVYFHNGDKMTAEDVAWSLNLIPENPNVTNANIPGFGHAEVVDETHVKVIMDTPFAAVDNFFASYHMVMLSKSYYEEVGWEGYQEHPIGTGPYKFVERAIGSYVKMEANEQYWNGAPDIKYFNLQILSDANSQLMALETGEVDALQNVSLANCEKVEQMDGFHVSYCTAKTVTYLYWGSLSKLTTDINQRRAVACAIDYDSISNVLNKGHTKPVTCMIAPGINARPEDGTFTHAYTYDPDASRKFLAESDYQEGDKIKVICVAGSKEETIGKVMVSNLQEVGIAAELAATDGATFMTVQSQGDFDLCLYSTLPSLYDCNLVYQYWIPGTTSFEKNSYPDKETLGQLGIASLTEMDPEARTEIFRQMLNIINEDALFLPLYQDCNTFCYNERATGIEAIPGTNVRIDSWTWAD